MADEPDADRAQDRIGDRKADRADTTESILENVEEHLGELEYPVTSEEIASEYGDDRMALPNETESLGSVFDRLAGEEFESAEEAREAIYGEITGQAGDRNEANPERDLESLDERSQDPVDEGGGNSL
ncbi:hypothetical protein EL22_00585 [Halostagnicola sp. A56]|uniref:DUF5789 family protein n=1 Tax=Halostagnicola sp. A56 TaxID=1495067 RepID=UPI0004A19425|nr:hypothetical protein [Halostagnicola sp. A56]KDE59079.1 hypothetical protein EL22_00585 [Halostagnicola sp. A56]